MIRIFISIILACALSATIGCGTSKPVPDVATLKLIDSKTESDGVRNHMILYAVNGGFSFDDFATLCTALKADPVSRGFNYIVVFDDVSSAGFPTSPFSSMYGMEEDRLSHIIAVYEFNAANGFSEARVYDPNMWTGKPTVSKL